MTQQRRQVNILLAGVGGQGIVIASRALALAAIRSGLKVKTSETIGMAQREGCVTSHVRIGDAVYSPLIVKGEADVVIGLEIAEAARYIPYVQEGGVVLVNDAMVVPVTVGAGLTSYDALAIERYLRSYRGARVVFVEGGRIAVECGSAKALNSVMLGALSGTGLLPVSEDVLLDSLLQTVPQKTVEMNRRAFEAGRESMTGLATRSGMI